METFCVKSSFKRTILAHKLRRTSALRSLGTRLEDRDEKNWRNTFNPRQVQHLITHPKLISFTTLFYDFRRIMKNLSPLFAQRP